jgi:hypothetical protein
MTYKKFDDLNFNEIDNGHLIGKTCRVYFGNGFGASIVSHNYSYGGKNGLYEIAVLDKTGEIRYDTSITNDVLGYLTENEVIETLEKIEKL